MKELLTVISQHKIIAIVTAIATIAIGLTVTVVVVFPQQKPLAPAYLAVAPGYMIAIEVVQNNTQLSGSITAIYPVDGKSATNDSIVTGVSILNMNGQSVNCSAFSSNSCPASNIYYEEFDEPVSGLLSGQEISLTLSASAIFVGQASINIIGHLQGSSLVFDLNQLNSGNSNSGSGLPSIQIPNNVTFVPSTLAGVSTATASVLANSSTIKAIYSDYSAATQSLPEAQTASADVQTVQFDVSNLKNDVSSPLYCPGDDWDTMATDINTAAGDFKTMNSEILAAQKGYDSLKAALQGSSGTSSWWNTAANWNLPSISSKINSNTIHLQGYINQVNKYIGQANSYFPQFNSIIHTLGCGFTTATEQILEVVIHIAVLLPE